MAKVRAYFPHENKGEIKLLSWHKLINPMISDIFFNPDQANLIPASPIQISSQVTNTVDPKSW